MSADLSRGIRLRAATASDDAAVRTLLASSSLATETSSLPPGAHYVAEARGVVVGVAILERFGGDGLLRAACVDAAWRGQGVGTALIEHVLTEAALAALDTVMILTEGAPGFFARFGFREVSSGEVPDPVARAVLRGHAPQSAPIPMQLRLAEP